MGPNPSRGLPAWQCDGRKEVREPRGLHTERSGGGRDGRTGAGGSRNGAPERRRYGRVAAAGGVERDETPGAYG